MGYAVKDDTGWHSTEFAPPAKRMELDPQLAFEGAVLYLAYTRVAVEEGGCGDDGLRDVGMQVRTRRLPAGGWSDPTLVGVVEDHVHSFRVVDGTIHATVENARDGRVYYVTSRGASYHRYLIPKATGPSALRVGDDGRARVAYEADGAIWYGVFTGAGFSTEKVDGGTNGYSPVLVLGAGDRPYLLWRRGYHEDGGCIGPGPEPIDGTYYSTQAGGDWQTERLSTEQGAASLTLDVDTGVVHTLVSRPDGLAYLYGTDARSWRGQLFEGVRTGIAVIRLDPTTGALLVAYVGREGNRERIFAMRSE
jgi:hypothetical protein